MQEYGRDLQVFERRVIMDELEEELLSARNMLELALLALRNNREELLPTALEELFYKTQTITENHCVKE